MFCILLIVHNIHAVDFPAKPNITKVSSTSTSINITWTQNLTSDANSFEIEYNFTISQCPDLGVLNGSLRIDNSSVRHYTLLNSSATPVEEDSNYTISLRAVNMAGNSEAAVYRTTTLEAGF